MSRAPGPSGGLFLGSLPAFKADPIACLAAAARDHGDIVRLRFGPVTAHLVSAPEHIDHVLSRNARGYDKATRSAARIAAATGDSLLSANATAWARHRRLIQPAFQPGCFDAIGPQIVALLDPALERWRDAGQIDIVDEMMQLVIAAAIRILFSADIPPRRVSDPLEVLLADTWRRIEAPLDPAMLTPRLHRRAFRRAVGQVDAIVLDLIIERRRTAQRPDDVLTRLIAARDGGGDTGLSDKELRDAAVTLLLAGHETTANALAWAVIHAAGEHHDADPQHLFSEALRLYPSIWVIERRAVHRDTIGGYTIPRGSSVLISPYLLHRDPRFWPDPDRFDPSRFAGDGPPRRAYLPFGLGPHRCVGLNLARAMAGHILSRLRASVTLTPLPGQSPVPRPGLTLRPSGPAFMAVSPAR